MVFKLICEECGREIIGKTRFRRFCDACKHAHRLLTEHHWNHSPKGITASQRRLDKVRQKPKRQPNFCIDCGKQVHRRSTRCIGCFRVIMKTWVLDKHPNWKGGKARMSGDYIRIRAPGHPRMDYKGYVAEHILIWEKAHAQPLPLGWIIHHLNGIKSDNRVCNLQALPNKKHYFLLQAKAKRIQELEALLNHQNQLL